MRAPAPRRLFTQWSGILFGATSGGPAADLALLVVRIALAWVFLYYGTAKLFGGFPGAGPNGIHQTALYMSHAAHLRPGELFAVLAGLTEFGGGVAMALGFCTRLAGLALFGDMVLATVTVTWATGLSSATSPPGYQLNLALAALAFAAALLGAGRYSTDALISRALGRRRQAASSRSDLAQTSRA
jgi:putative oxidoreductase